VAGQFGDDEAFEQLRVGPFHRAIRARHPHLADPIDACVTDLTTKHQCLVHGDYSPKNVLVGTDGLWVLDFEVAHVGAAVFDVAFLECHLLLKAMHRPRDAALFRAGAAAFVAAYTDSLDRPPSLDRLGWHTACLLLARVDGTSPAGYLSANTSQRVRQLATELLSDADTPMAEVWNRAVAPGGSP
jgi:5-methylthioribose kinase